MTAAPSKREHALAHARAGRPVFPLQGKIPAVANWKDWATTDAGKINEYWTAHPDANPGLPMGVANENGLKTFAIDVDIKNGKDGFSVINDLETLNGDLPATARQDTPTGGAHLIFTSTEDIGNGVDVLGPGVDVRGIGGYIVGAGSTIDGKPYFANDLPAHEAPRWLVNFMPKRRTKSPAPVAADFEGDTQAQIERATRWLQNDAPPAIEGQGGDAATFKTACKLKDFGISEGHALTLVTEFWNEKCRPPWTPEDLAAKVAHAYRYGFEPPGVADPATAFKPVLADLPKSRFNVRLAGETKPKLDNKWLIQGVLPEGGMALMSAAPNRMKSFVAIDMGMAHARGAQWQGRDTKKSACLYVGPDGDITNRVVAYVKHNSLDGVSIPFAFITETVNLYDKSADIEPLIELAKSVALKTGLPLGSIVIDTLHSVLAGGDENSGQDMGAVMFHGSRLKDETGATILFVHHLGKDQSKGARGHSSLMGKVDTAMEMDDHGILTVKKQRDGKRGEQFGFELSEVVLGQDSAGRDVTSCVVVPVSVGANNAFGIAAVKPGSINSKALVVLQDMTMNGDGTLVSAWKADFVTKHYPQKRKSGGTAFDRAREALCQTGNITMEGEYASPAE